jgi:hypothetical protein
MRLILQTGTLESILFFEITLFKRSFYFRIRPTWYVREPNTNKRFSYGFYKWTE